MTFDGLIGQDVVAETIINSIKADKIPNAYLFTGIRGVGKTSIARIVAKALNCSNGIDNLCKENLCENCVSITNSSHIDVMELNGADKTSISDIDLKNSSTGDSPCLANFTSTKVIQLQPTFCEFNIAV